MQNDCVFSAQCGHAIRQCFLEYSLHIPYRTKFSRHVIFLAFFADWNRTSKIKLSEMFEYRIDASGILDLRKLFPRNFLQR